MQLCAFSQTEYTRGTTQMSPTQPHWPQKSLLSPASRHYWPQVTMILTSNCLAEFSSVLLNFFFFHLFCFYVINISFFINRQYIAS